MEERVSNTGIEVYRASSAPTLAESGCEIDIPPSDLQATGIQKLLSAGYTDGFEVNVLVNIPGFSLVWVWFKQNFPLPLHSHDVDCLYYIIAGSLRLGTEELGVRDSFFIPANVPYTYKTGSEGVELLEIRHANKFEFRNLARNMAFYEKAADTIVANRDAWRSASRMSERPY